MRDRSTPEGESFADQVFDIAGTDPEQLHSGRIPDPQPEHTPLFRWFARTFSRIEEFLRARGGQNLRFGIRFVWGMLAAIGIFLLVGPIINKPMDFDQVLASAKVGEVDWLARDMHVDYEVSRAKDGTFAAEVTERYEANFVNGPENRIERKIVTEVNGHDTEFEVLKATIDGAPAEVKLREGATTSTVELRRADGEKLTDHADIEFVYEIHHLVASAHDDATDATVDEWEWPVFSPTLPQGLMDIEVSVTFSNELNDALVRKPAGSLGWLLIMGNVWMEPEPVYDGVRYSFTQDEHALPPYADVWVSASFKPGTFTQPPETALFWWQTYGPLIPLVLLGALVPFAFAARKIVWADTAGDPWYVSRSEPPKDLSPELAAQLMRTPRHAELVAALAAAPRVPFVGSKRKKRHAKLGPNRTALLQQERESWLKHLAQVGRRAGRLGSIPVVSRWRTRWSKRGEVMTEKLRWAPDSYLRDSFILAPIALTLLQWGILRQLSHQVILLVVWWPAVFVLGSTVLALIVLWAVSAPRPLTKQGALLVQQLKGIDVYAKATRLLERGPLDDALLPYAVLFESPRRAGNAITEQAIRESGDRALARGWRGSRFISMPAMLSFIAAAAVFAGSIVLVATQAAPFDKPEYQTWPSSEFKGTVWTQVEGFDVDAELTKSADGAAKLEVVEHLNVRFTPSGSSVPQLEREWPSDRLGQSLGFTLDSVTVDGDEVPFRTVQGLGTVAMTTQLADVLDGLQDVEIHYMLDSPVSAVTSLLGTEQELRWSAMLWFWEDTFYTNAESLSEGTAPVRPLRVQLTVAPEIVPDLSSGGWIDYSDTKNLQFERGSGMKPWVYEHDVYLEDAEHEGLDAVWHELRIGSTTTRDDGALVVALDASEVQSRTYDRVEVADGTPPPYAVDEAVNSKLEKYELDADQDLGAVLHFAPGTFSNVNVQATNPEAQARSGSLTLLIVLTLVPLLAAVAVSLWAWTRERVSVSLGLVAVGTVSLLAAAQTVVFWWVVGPMTDNDGTIAGMNIFSVAMWAAVVGQWFVLGRVAATSQPKSGKLTK